MFERFTESGRQELATRGEIKKKLDRALELKPQFTGSFASATLAEKIFNLHNDNQNRYINKGKDLFPQGKLRVDITRNSIQIENSDRHGIKLDFKPKDFKVKTVSSLSWGVPEELQFPHHSLLDRELVSKILQAVAEDLTQGRERWFAGLVNKTESYLTELNEKVPGAGEKINFIIDTHDKCLAQKPDYIIGTPLLNQDGKCSVIVATTSEVLHEWAVKFSQEWYNYFPGTDEGIETDFENDGFERVTLEWDGPKNFKAVIVNSNNIKRAGGGDSYIFGRRELFGIVEENFAKFMAQEEDENRFLKGTILQTPDYNLTDPEMIACYSNQPAKE